MNTVPQIIFIPGLGADERLFEFTDIKNCQKECIKWIKPLPGESFKEYLKKIMRLVNTEEPPVLIGVSLGGIVSMELREMIPVKKTILISSIKSHEEMPPYFNWIRKMRLNEKVPVSFLKKSAPLIKPFISGTKNEKALQLFKEMFYDADEEFMTWAIKKVLEWEKKSYDKKDLVHIHGTKDLIFPFRYIKDCDYIIKGGTHDMVMSKPAEINAILEKEIFS